MLKRVLLILFLAAVLISNQLMSADRTTFGKMASKLKAKTASIGLRSNINYSGVNDAYYYRQWIIGFTNSDLAWRILRPKKVVKIALVDSGVDYNNPDLKNRVLKNSGYNFVNDNTNVMDYLGHGTQVAGIIAAQGGNKIGITGIVGGLNVKLIPVKVLDNQGRGPSDVVANGIRYGADMGADIINVSIDFEVHDRAIEDALNYAWNKGSFVVVASGNSNSSCDSYSPAGDEYAYTVAAIDEQYKRPYFSSYGKAVKVAAPGVDILTTTLSDNYEEESGTSMSAPIVAGIAAMMKAQNPSLTPNQIASILNSSAMDVIDKGWDKYSGYGLVNAYKAVLCAN